MFILSFSVQDLLFLMIFGPLLLRVAEFWWRNQYFQPTSISCHPTKCQYELCLFLMFGKKLKSLGWYVVNERPLLNWNGHFLLLQFYSLLQHVVYLLQKELKYYLLHLCENVLWYLPNVVLVLRDSLTLKISFSPFFIFQSERHSWLK